MPLKVLPSTCADKAHDTACHDEVVIYEVDSSASARGPVRWVADKVVNGTRENMGVLRLQYDTTTHVWSTDLNMRIAGVMAGAPMPEDVRPLVRQGAIDEGRVVIRITPYGSFETPPRHVHSVDDLAGLNHWASSVMPWT